MLARVITLRFDPALGSFDDSPLRDFLKEKEVLSLREYFFVKHDIPYMAVLVTYDLPPAAPAPQVVTAPRNKADTSWQKWVADADLPLFNTLRDWRAERSKRDGVPPYVICTNRQFAAMVQTRPQSLTALAEIEGFGRAKLEKYGQDLVAMLQHTTSTEPPPPTSVATQESAHEQPTP
ncbi:MAG: HRDC domain-containing protein [Candidatus Tectimicrobiota bacterium]